MYVKKYEYNLNVFTDENEFSYYLLGAFITDGCVYKTYVSKNIQKYACQLSSSDKNWLKSISMKIGNNLNIHAFSSKYFGIRILRNDIANWFIAHGCEPKKTYNLKLPNVPDEYFKFLLLGIIDGDGSIGCYPTGKYFKKVCQIISASEIFLKQIQENY